MVAGYKSMTFSLSDFLAILAIMNWQALMYLGVRYLIFNKRDDYDDKKMRKVLAIMFIGGSLVTAFTVAIL